jgi:hypothetical protein
MAGGYAGKILMVDLTTGTIREETPLEETYRQYIGGTGLGVRMLYDRMKPRVDPLGPENMLGFVTGPLTATSVTGSVCHNHEKKQKGCFGVSGMGVKGETVRDPEDSGRTIKAAFESGEPRLVEVFVENRP